MKQLYKASRYEQGLPLYISLQYTVYDHTKLKEHRVNMPFLAYVTESQRNRHRRSHDLISKLGWT